MAKSKDRGAGTGGRDQKKKPRSTTASVLSTENVTFQLAAGAPAEPGTAVIHPMQSLNPAGTHGSAWRRLMSGSRIAR